MGYLESVKSFYKDAATRPQENLCCAPGRRRTLPGLVVPDAMDAMDYGCGSTVHGRDLRAGLTAVYVGVGGGLELLELAYYTRGVGKVIGVDPVGEMLEAARRNLEAAAQVNEWFDPSFVELRLGDAMQLPVDDGMADVAGQNCLFNIFRTGGDLEQALAEMYRVLGRGGRLVMSDPVAQHVIPQSLRDDDRLRAMCLSGCLTFDEYVEKIVQAGFGQVEVRSRRPYRVLDVHRYDIDAPLVLESIEIAGIKVPIPDDGACVFTGRTATYVGVDNVFDDGKGHALVHGMPSSVCDKTARALVALGRDDLLITESTWHYSGDGCC